MKLGTILAVAVAMVTASSAMAASITYNATSTPAIATVANSASLLTTPVTVNIPTFDLSAYPVGTFVLDSISFKLTGTATGSISLVNNTATARYMRGVQNISITLTDPLDNDLVVVTPTQTYDNSVTKVPANTTKSSGSVTLAPVSDTIVWTDAAVLSEFSSVGPSTLAASLSAVGVYIGYRSTDGVNWTLGNVTNTSVTGTGTAGGSFEVTYTYHAVPEPATLGLLGVGAAALLAGRRRKA